MTTPEARRMAAIVAVQAKTLKIAGFKKKRYSFNRKVNDGLVHVVGFLQAQYTSSEYGRFGVTCGVYIPEMTRVDRPRSDWINDYNCDLRPGIMQVLPHQMWWVADPAAETMAGAYLAEHVLPWLELFPDRTSVLEAFERSGSQAIGLFPSGNLDIADVYRAIGRFDDERRALERYVQIPHLSNHVAYLAEYLRKHGHDDLIPSIQVKP